MLTLTATCVEQHTQDIYQAVEKLKEAQSSATKLHKELGKLGQELQASEVTPTFPYPHTLSRSYGTQVSHAKAEKDLQEERATLTQFDNELKELELVIKGKKQTVSDAELQLEKLKYDVQTLVKEKTASTNFVANLEKQYDWIQD